MTRAYLSAHDAKMKRRTRAAIMREMVPPESHPHGRCARTFCTKALQLPSGRERSAFNLSLSNPPAGLSEGIEGDSKDDNDADNDLLNIR
jgi:hypothetical protein